MTKFFPKESLVDQERHLGDMPFHDANNNVKIKVDNVNFWYGKKQALYNINIDIFDREVMAFIGPSGCGKTTLLRCLNRMNETINGTHMTGKIHLDGQNINAEDVDPPLLRRRFGWVAQKPNPFPWSVYDNVAYGARLHGIVSSRQETDELVYNALKSVGLWEEVKDRLKEVGTDLSGGQQQRLCVARALSTNSEVLLMDEPASALDPHATGILEDLIAELKKKYCIIIITHNMQEAARISQRTAFFHLGKLLEVANTEDMFLHAENELCRDYVTGKFG